MKNLEIVYIDTDLLNEYEGNTKKHTEDDIRHIVESIKQFGFNDAIGIWGDENTVVEGHGRLIAAKRLGLKQVPCIRLDHMTDNQRKAYGIIHNQLTLNTQFNTDVLRAELDTITDVDMKQFDVGIKEGISPEELKQLFTDEPVEKKPKKKKDYICPCCGKSFQL